MKVTSIALPSELTDRIDRVARDSERSRSFVVRKLLETALTGEDRLAALRAAADHELEEANKSHEPKPNALAGFVESCTDGRTRLDALQNIAATSQGKHRD